jgi:hypothetical protein
VGAEGEAAVELSPIQLGRTMHILRFFANRYSKEPRESYVSVEAVRKTLQKTLDVELRYDEVKACVKVLAQRGFLEKAPVGDNVVFRVSPVGFEYWIKGRPLFSMMM